MDILRAKELIAGLADGVNPLTGEILPDDSVCNQPEILRALHTVLSELSPKVAKQFPVNAGKPWTEVEANKLIDRFDAGTKISVMAKKHGRTRGAIESRLHSLGKIERVPRFPKKSRCSPCPPIAPRLAVLQRTCFGANPYSAQIRYK